MTAGLRDERGQTTTEYAILVGFLAVALVVAVVAFRGQLRGVYSRAGTSLSPTPAGFVLPVRP